MTRLSLLGTFLATLVCALCRAQTTPAFPMERIDRGVVALPAQDKGVFVSWRMLGYDSPDVTFDLERDGTVIARGLTLTNHTDPQGTPASRYRVTAIQNGRRQPSAEVMPWADLYLSMPVNRPQGGTVSGQKYAYTPNDCSVGDVDGDGQYELILKWDPTNAHDNSHGGHTGNVIIDCYKMDGRQLWRIDLGRNIRAGAHYTQFLVYDFDGDGRAEMVCKTAPASTDGSGRYVSTAATDPEIRRADNRADYADGQGRVVSGPEYLTVFRGSDGRAMHTVWYTPNRNFGVGGSAPYGDWGDKKYQGNRGDRFLACVAYLDGPQKNPSAVMCRGYYTRSYLWAVDYDGRRLTTKWLHASTTPADWTLADASGRILKEAHNLRATAYGQGAHSIAVADVDGDGCDEITYGSAAIDHDGSLLYSTGLGHGDAQHLADLDPDREGLEYYMVHEAYPYGADLRDARTGEILYHEPGRSDTGRGMAADIDSLHRGAEMWNLERRIVRDIHGDSIAADMPAMNFRIYWDGDVQDELLANTNRPSGFRPYLQKWNGRKAVPLLLSNGRQLHEMGHSVSNNWSKATPCLQADITGDWREELIFWDSSDSCHLNIFTTNIPTPHRIPTLMHDHVYRMGIAWQNVGYNQPPHLGYYLPDAVRRKKR